MNERNKGSRVLPQVINGKIRITESCVIEKGLTKIIKIMKDPNTTERSYCFFNHELVKLYSIAVADCPYSLEELQQIV